MRPRLSFRHIALLFLAICVFARNCYGQAGTTSLHGAVFDTSHSAVAGAKVTLANQAQGLARNAVTSPTGEFGCLLFAACEFWTLP